MQDYLIIPIQRVARYGLLLAGKYCHLAFEKEALSNSHLLLDLLKHTQPSHSDYNNLIKAHQIVTSLASAMNSVQKKKKKAWLYICIIYSLLHLISTIYLLLAFLIINDSNIYRKNLLLLIKFSYMYTVLKYSAILVYPLYFFL